MNRSLAGAIIAAVACALASTPAGAQSFPNIPSAISSALPALLPPVAATPSGVRRIGKIDVAPVMLGPVHLFDITAAATQTESGELPVLLRTEIIDDNLQQVISLEEPGLFGLRAAHSNYNAGSFRVEVKRDNQHPVLYASDDAHAPVALVTVTESDARFYGIPSDELATRWQQRLTHVVGGALTQRDPESIHRQIAKIPYIVAIALALTALLYFGRRALERQGANVSSMMAANVRRLNLLEWVSFWGLFAVWIGGVIALLALFPDTVYLATRLFSRMIGVMSAWLVAGLVDFGASIVVTRFAAAWERSRFVAEDDMIRRAVRIPTIVRAILGVKTIVIYAIAILVALGIVGVPVTSVVAFGALIAFAISFAAQNLIKDVANGLLILLEDQYAVGDTIGLNGIAGRVERLNLRSTQLRDDNGRAITIPNNLVGIVENYTKNWSRVDYRVTIAPTADVDQALSALGKVLADVYADPRWHPSIRREPAVLGVESFSASGVVLRAWVETAPGQQAPIARDINLRLHAALAHAGIPVTVPQFAIVTPPPPPPTTDQPPA